MLAKTDSEVEQWVLRELNLTDQSGSREICVLAREGVITLRGSAESDEDKSAVEKATLRATGVLRVVNEVRVKACTALINRVSASVPPPEVFRPGMFVPPSAIPHPVSKAATP